VERADRYAAPDTPARVYANIGVAEQKAYRGILSQQFDISREGIQLLIGNVELARRLADPEAFWLAACARMANASAPQHFKARLELAEEMAQISRTRVAPRLYGLGLSNIIAVLLESGQRRRAEEFIGDLKQTAERSGQVNLLIVSMGMDAGMATLDGDLEKAVAICQSLFERAGEPGITQWAILVGTFAGYRALFELGRWEEIARLMRSLPAHLQGLLQFFDNSDTAAAKVLEQWIEARSGMSLVEDETPATFDMELLKMAVRVGHRPAAEFLLRRFAGCGIRMAGTPPTCVALHLGAAAAFLGRLDEARVYYQEALQATTEMRFRPEVALTRLQLAELLLEHYPDEKADALEHLDFAVKEFRDMKMQPSLERALKLHSKWLQK
jgi:tetratricopeptide (TPR) repeat protein